LWNSTDAVDDFSDFFMWVGNITQGVFHDFLGVRSSTPKSKSEGSVALAILTFSAIIPSPRGTLLPDAA
jgi:hypothetical protein